MPLSVVLRLPVLLAALCALLIFTVRVIGHAQPPPAALAVLQLDACALPCWLHIALGVTPFADAIERVRQASPSGIFTSGYGTAVTAAYLLGSPLGQVGIYADARGAVSQLTLLTYSVQGITFGDVVSFLGTPACILRDPAAVIYTSPTAFAVLMPSQGASHWRAPLDHVEIRPIAVGQSPCATLTN